MAEEENVKVAVRVRPFNSREKAMGSTLIVAMDGPRTILTDPDTGEEKDFVFDYSYWSHDGSVEQANGYITPAAGNTKFADQKKVYDDLGTGVAKNAWDGYNSTLFAYGQTGSGKSWSVVGYGINKGIVPMFSEELFHGIDEKKQAGSKTQFEVKFSMLEIYSEKVRDLLNPTPNKKKSLKIREHPKKGFYVEGLKTQYVDTYAAIEQQMEEGTHNRTIAATNMNATSSRAHTIVGITFIQKSKNKAGQETAKSSIVNLVDLAGSERAESTGATGDRLKEGAAINQSLSALGNVIAALADNAGGKKMKVPFRDSVLTKLLKNALGGNSKTIMVAAISPADINYSETLSTLRYADRAKQIKTSASVNEDPTEKLIRELKEENEKLARMLKEGGVLQGSGDAGDLNEEELEELRRKLEEEMKAELEENEREMEEMRKSYEEKLKAAEESAGGLTMSRINEARKTTPNLYNLNMDAQLSGMICHLLEVGENTIGNKGCDITLQGPSMLERHAKIVYSNVHEPHGMFRLERMNTDARTLVNGEPLTGDEAEELHHNDRVMFGTTQLYVFVNPRQRDDVAVATTWMMPTYESAQNEIASHAGLAVSTETKSQDEYLLQEDLVELTQAVEEANSISEELDKHVRFEIVLASPQARGQLAGRTELYVRMRNLDNDLEWTWTRQKFLNRKFVMQEMFENYSEGEDWDLPDEKDPFTEAADAEQHIGTVALLLESLSYMIELTEQLEVTDYRGLKLGMMNVELLPCDSDGRVYTEKDNKFVENPNDLLGKNMHVLVKVASARGLPSRYTDMYVKYTMFLDEEFSTSQIVPNTSNPEFDFSKQFDFTPVTKQLLEYLATGTLMLQVWGKQKPTRAAGGGGGGRTKNTRQMNKSEMLAMASATPNEPNKQVVNMKMVVSGMKQHIAEKKVARLEEKMLQLRKMLEMAERSGKPRVHVQIIRGVMEAGTSEATEKALALIQHDNVTGSQHESTACTVL